MTVHCDKGENSDLPVAPAVDRADGQTEPGTAWDVHHVEELQPLVPSRVVGLHFFCDLRLTQSFRSVIDTSFHINLQRRSFLSKCTNTNCPCLNPSLSETYFSSAFIKKLKSPYLSCFFDVDVCCTVYFDPDGSVNFPERNGWLVVDVQQ